MVHELVRGLLVFAVQSKAQGSQCVGACVSRDSALFKSNMCQSAHGRGDWGQAPGDCAETRALKVGPQTVFKAHTSALAPRLRSSTMRMPSRSLSSCTSEMPASSSSSGAPRHRVPRLPGPGWRVRCSGLRSRDQGQAIEDPGLKWSEVHPRS